MECVFLALPARRLEESRAFWIELLGLPLVEESETGPMPWFEVQAGAVVLRLYEWTEEYHHRGHTGIHLATSDLEGNWARLSEAGIRLTEIRVEPWGGRVATVWDPSDNNFDLVDRASV